MICVEEGMHGLEEKRHVDLIVRNDIAKCSQFAWPSVHTKSNTH